MPYITNETTARTTNTKEKDVEAIEARVITSLNHVSQAHATIVVPVTHLRNVRQTEKNVFTVISKVTSHSFVTPSNVVNLLVQCEKFLPKQ